MSVPMRFLDDDYKNWIKCSFSLQLMKEGLHQYLDSNVQYLHRLLKQNVAQYSGSSTFAIHCGTCSANDICKRGRYWQISCPNQQCNIWLNEILSFHNEPNNNKICWKNSDISKWPSDPYHVARIFMPNCRQTLSHLPQDLDIAAVLSFLKYCNLCSKKYTPHNQLLCDLIEIRNQLMHSGQLRISDTVKDKWMKKVLQMILDINLQGTFYSEITRLKNEDYDMNYRETEIRVLQNMVFDMASNLSKVKEEIETLSDETQKGRDVSAKAAGKVVTVESDVQEIKKSLNEFKEISGKLKVFLDQNPDIADKEITRNIRSIEKDVSESQIKFNDLEARVSSLEEEVRGIKRKFSAIEQEEVEENQAKEIECLCNHLLSKYKSLRTISISPTDETDDVAPFKYLYTDVMINCTDEEKTSSFSSKGNNMRRQEMGVHKLTSYKQLFERRHERIIVTGHSGSGKTTFLRKCVNIWYKLQKRKKLGADADVTEELLDHESVKVIAHEEILLNFDLLFYIYSPAISVESKSIVEVLCNHCIRKELGREKQKILETIAKILDDSPDKIMIIFDGVDEMGDTPNFLKDLFNRDIYPQVTVLMGMRHWKISQLGLKRLKHYDMSLDIQGFSTENALEFVSKVIDLYKSQFGEAQAIDHSLSVKDKMVFSQFKHVPLLLHFLAHIWYRDKSLPDKLKDLYNQTLDCLIVKCLKKTGKKYTDTILDEESRDRHVKMFREKYLDSACKVAHHFLLQGQNGPSAVISHKKLIQELGIDAVIKHRALLDWGIMAETERFSPFEKNVSVTFLHLSIQEYLASIYLVQNAEAFQIFLASIKMLNDIHRYRNLFIFICGLSASQGRRALHRICQMCDKDPLRAQYRQSLDDESQERVSVTNLDVMYKACLNELDVQEHLDIPDICSTSSDWYRLIKSRLQPCCLKFLYLRWNRFDESEYLDLSAFTNLTSLALLDITTSEASSRTLCYKSLSGCFSLEYLTLERVTLYGCILDLGRLTNLKFLRLSTLKNMSKECSRSLLRSIKNCTRLENIAIDQLTLHDGLLDFSTLTYLTSLRLSWMTMPDHCSRSLCSGIRGCTNLKKMWFNMIKLHDGVFDFDTLTKLTCITLSEVTMPEECSRSLCRSIRDCTNLEEVVLKYLNLHDGVMDLNNLTNLISLKLDHLTISKECGKSLCSSIKDCTHLKKLNLDCITLHDGVINLVNLTKLTSLTLNDVTMSEECSMYMCNNIGKCIQLEKIKIMNLALHNGVLELHSLPYLTSLSLCDVIMSEECSRSLCINMRFCYHLEKLDHVGQEFNMQELPDDALDWSTLTNLKFIKLQACTKSYKCRESLCRSIKSCAQLKNWVLNISILNNDGNC